jgi:cytochrome c
LLDTKWAIRFSLLLLPSFVSSQTLSYPGCDDLKASDFSKVLVGSGGVSALKFTIAPDGRIFVAGQNGQITIVDSKTGTATDAGKLTDIGNSIWGLAGITLDPGFATNGRIFVYCTRPVATDSAVSAIRRVTLVNNKLDLTTEKFILEWPVNRVDIDHSGGGMAFDKAGNLYLGTGDNSNWTLEYGSISEAKVNLNSLRSAANTNDLRGKVIRIKPLPIADQGSAPTPGPGTTYEIPAGNLFPAGTAQTRPEIYTMGQRNPFSLTIDPVTDWLYVADIGPQAAQSSTTKGPAAIDEFNVVKDAGNYGWPMFAGANVPYNKYDYVGNKTGPLFDSTKPLNDSKFNTGLQNLPLPRSSVIHYSKDGKNMDLTGFTKGAQACIGGPVYRYQDYQGSSIKLPPHFDGKWIVGDNQMGWLKALVFDANGTKGLAAIELFEGTKISSLIDIKLGADGALYTLDLGRNVNRFEYKGDCKPPTIGLRENIPFARRDPKRDWLFISPTQTSLIRIPEGKRGFSLFNMQGKKMGSFRATGNSQQVPVSLANLGATGIVRLRFE